MWVQVNAIRVQARPGKGPSKKARFYGLGPSSPSKSLNLKYARESSRGDGSRAHTHAWFKIQAFYLDCLDPAPFYRHLRAGLTWTLPGPLPGPISSEVSL